jgi:pectinesterase
MKTTITIVLFVVLAEFPNMMYAFGSERANLIVAQDGSGQYTTIQEAIDVVPGNNRKNFIILIKNGTYREKLFIQKSFITLVGEDRDSARIIYPELRENWNKAHYGSDWGAAVVNIDSTVTDVTIANMTIYNNYGSLNGGIHSHQFAILSSGTRIILLYCNVIADGNDTVSMWNRAEGMYYHAECYFEGWVDYVCPRGYCYITDSRFFGHNLNASIWHDGSRNKNHKFVIRYSLFDGISNFPLGRHHRDAQIYLLNCIFSRNMADKPFYLPKSPNSVPWIWSARHYFFDCHREGGDYDWFKDNLTTAEGSPGEDVITAKWTFDNKWDPEDSMPAVLPFVSLPSPRNGAYSIPTKQALLRWTPARNAESHVVHFGTSATPDVQKTTNQHRFELGPLLAKTTYFWRVDEIIGADTLKGPLWHFTAQ